MGVGVLAEEGGRGLGGLVLVECMGGEGKGDGGCVWRGTREGGEVV